MATADHVPIFDAMIFSQVYDGCHVSGYQRFFVRVGDSPVVLLDSFRADDPRYYAAAQRVRVSSALRREGNLKTTASERGCSRR